MTNVVHKTYIKIFLALIIATIVASVLCFTYPAIQVNGHFTPIIEIEEIINSPLISLFFKLPFKIPYVSQSNTQIPLLLLIPCLYIIALILTITLFIDSLTGVFKHLTRFILSVVDILCLIGCAISAIFSKQIIINFCADKFGDKGKTSQLISTLSLNTQVTIPLIVFLGIMVGLILILVFITSTSNLAILADYRYLQKHPGAISQLDSYGEVDYGSTQSAFKKKFRKFKKKVWILYINTIGPTIFYLRVNMCDADYAIKKIIYAIGRFFKKIGLIIANATIVTLCAIGKFLFICAKPFIYYAIVLYNVFKNLFIGTYKYIIKPLALFIAYLFKAFVQYCFYGLIALLQAVFKLIIYIIKEISIILARIFYPLSVLLINVVFVYVSEAIKVFFEIIFMVIYIPIKTLILGICLLCYSSACEIKVLSIVLAKLCKTYIFIPIKRLFAVIASFTKRIFKVVSEFIKRFISSIIKFFKCKNNKRK